MKKTNKFLMIVICIMFSAATFANGTITGKVLDADNNESLIGATVMFEGTTFGTTADLDGSFLFSAPAGSYTLHVSFVGYLPQTMDVTLSEGQALDLGDIMLKSSSIGLLEVSVFADVAVNRKTPVAVSSIKAEEIETKLGGRDLPAVLNITPGVYSTHNGGGYGDSRVNVRGFKQNNVAVMINGIPVNDMESGWVYWSNWAGLGDATSQMQIQRGLGASKLAINAVGGVMNIITKTTDIQKGGSFRTSLTSYGLKKNMLSLSTGQMKGGTAIQFVGSRTQGEGYVDGTWVDAWSYYLAVSQVINKDHRLAFTIVGAPQEHGQRRSSLSQQDINDYGPNYNSQWGWYKGEMISERVNYYHKPQALLNWYWDINDKNFLSTSAYFSTGTGGGSGPLSSRSSSSPSGSYDRNYNIFDARGQIDYNTIIDDNATHNDYFRGSNGNGIQGGFSKRILRNSVNNHNWYGILSTLNHKSSDNLNLMFGIDARKYKGEHYREVRDLLGGEYYYEEYKYAVDGVAGRDQIKGVGERIAYDNDGQVSYGGLFGQAEYSKDNLTAFATGTISNTWFKRVDRYNYVNNQESETVSAFGYNFKLGANINLDDQNNFFVNTGYYSRAPEFRFLWPNYTNVLSTTNLQNEKVFGFEAGYGYRAKNFAMNVNAYYTYWSDKSLLTRPYVAEDGTETSSFISGLDAKHIGLELEANWRVAQDLNLGFIASFGNWKWMNDVSATVTDDQTQEQYTTNLYVAGLKVSNQPQTQVGMKVDYWAFKNIKLTLEMVGYDGLYADFSPEDYDDASNTDQSWKLPAYVMTNFYIGYNFTFAGLKSWAGINIYNALNVDHWVDGFDGSGHDRESFRGYKGYGRNFNFSMKVNF